MFPAKPEQKDAPNPQTVDSIPTMAASVEAGTPEATPVVGAGLDALSATPAYDPSKKHLDQAELDRLAADMFERASLSSWQKWVVFFSIAAVITLFIGGGIALFVVLDPFAGYQSTEDANQGASVGDTDNDKLSDIEEVKAGTNANAADTDGDGLNDYDEVKIYKTKPTVPDTDGDSYNDGAEVLNGYDPLGPGRL